MATEAVKLQAPIDDTAAIRRIVSRAKGIETVRKLIELGRWSGSGGWLDLELDLTACHMNGCPLRLADMEKADAFNLAHDLLGIRQHIDRNTGRLAGCFAPRFARRT